MSDNRKAVVPKACDSLLITLPVPDGTILICQNFVGLWKFLKLYKNKNTQRLQNPKIELMQFASVKKQHTKIFGEANVHFIESSKREKNSPPFSACF